MLQVLPGIGIVPNQCDNAEQHRRSCNTYSPVQSSLHRPLLVSPDQRAELRSHCGCDCAMLTGKPEVIGSDSQFLVCRQLKDSAFAFILQFDFRCVTYFCPRIEGVKVMPTSNPSGEMKRLTIWPHGSFLFLTSIRCPRDSSSAVALSTLSTSNSRHPSLAPPSSAPEPSPNHDSAP